MKLLFATGNQNKFKEVRNMIPNTIELLSLTDIDFEDEIPETSNTIEGNALQKARFAQNRTGLSCFADDTGLMVNVLNGEPGVYSARYAGLDCSSEHNMDKLLSKMEGQTNRSAHFDTVIALILNGKEFVFSGRVYGQISTERSGNKGFGYDPIFKPQGNSKTFAEMPLFEKNQISHRAIALNKLNFFLKSL